MFLGHYGLALAAKALAPKTSLGSLVFAGNLADEVWPILLVLGLEHVHVVPGLMEASAMDFQYYPYTHSLTSAVAVGAIVGGLYGLIRGYSRGALLMGLLVASHWFIDLPFHRADLPLWPGGPLVGLGGWNSLPFTLVAEALTFGGGLGVYLWKTKAIDAIGKYALAGFAMFLLLVYVGSMFGPPPTSDAAVGWSSLSLWLFVPWGVWIDRHREFTEAR